jgi:hypothetical protein
MQSHHSQSQTRAAQNVANFNANKSPTTMVTKAEHQQISKTMNQQMKQQGADYNKRIGTAEAVKQAADNMKQAGVPETKANQAALAENGYLKGTTPLNQVKSTLGGPPDGGGPNKPGGSSP